MAEIDTILAGLRHIVEALANRVPLFSGFAKIHLVAGGDGFGQGNTDLGFPGSDQVRTCMAERGGISKVGAAHKDAKTGVEEPRLPDDLSRVLDICTQDQAAGRCDPGFFERAGPQDIAIDRCKTLRASAPYRLEIQINDCDYRATILQQAAYDLPDRPVADEDASSWIVYLIPVRTAQAGSGR
jgi:hypothetical protein